ncbi:MAG: hypothetical protein ACOZDY_17530 [Pseudomonadota bacterium]
MPRKLLTADQIREEVSRRLAMLPEVREDQATIVVPLPQWNEPDERGCNWHMSVFGGDAVGYTRAIQRVVADVQALYQLAPGP